MESAVGNYKGKGLSAFDKKPLGELYGNKQLINKRIPINPKYSDVKSMVDHGKSTRDVESLSDSLIAKKKGENFGRIQPKTLAQFLEQSNNEESIIGLMKGKLTLGTEADKENFDT